MPRLRGFEPLAFGCGLAEKISQRIEESMRHSKTIEGHGEVRVRQGSAIGARTYRIEEWQRERDAYYLQGAPRSVGQLKEDQVWIELSAEDRAALEDKDATLTIEDGRRLRFRVKRDGEIDVLVGLH